jgi:hypothetical protein
MLGLVIWQVALGHSVVHQVSNASLVGWTIFVWLVYLRLRATQLVTEVCDGELIIRLSGLWVARRVPLSDIASVEMITFDPVRDYRGYGIRSDRSGKAYIAEGTEGLRISLVDGATFVVGSQCSPELSGLLRREP